MHYSLKELEGALSSVPQFIFEKEKNIFDVGTRGFYENPFTDVLAYILDSKSEYKGRNLFIKYLLQDHFPEEVVNSFMDRCSTTTQHKTNMGNRIDLLLYNNRYLILFENKIYHTLNNPLEDYKDDITSKYPHLEKFFVIMSYKNEHVPQDWKYINIQKIFYKILKDPSTSLNDKWDYFVKDFLLQFSDKQKLKMEQDITEFIENNFSKILDARDKLDSYIQGLAERIKNETDSTYRINNKNWAKNEIAIRFYPFSDENSAAENNKTENNVTLIFTDNGKLNVSPYYYVDFKENSQDIHKRLGEDRYQLWEEGNICYLRINEDLRYSTIEEATSEVIVQIQIMREYYREKKPGKV
ncbi:PD-(D/E)XK nuclease family protein [Chryseobacterium sp. OV279]|uniref:PD-(D/E)XK nuclease family protein n=1 Tax=Chryseobacterium sp. OV279 TaxID=1500285 RepID=UPI000923792C|nr:PD-(D/E)XK nuclease family protein [Chryseobacterium sp. OV279]SHE97104.1 PD-(D/E)XK nuclease superfamily protein [Chryseobacterium sp. OV279]